jgi:hypothetical protein
MQDRFARRAARAWNVRVEFPERCPRSDAEKTMVAYAVHKVFVDRYVDISTLRDVRRLLDQGTEARPDDAVEMQLRLLHCEKFERLPAEVLDLVPTLVGRYLGVTVTRLAGDDVPTLRPVPASGAPPALDPVAEPAPRP